MYTITELTEVLFMRNLKGTPIIRLTIKLLNTVEEDNTEISLREIEKV